MPRGGFIGALLSAIQGLSANGLIARTSASEAAARTLQAPAAGITIANPAGTAGDPTFALANMLAALEALAATPGFLAVTGADALSVRTLAGTTNQISITNPAGAVGDPVFSAPQNLDTAAAFQVGSLNVSDGNITNVGDVALDSLSADATAISVVLSGAAGADFIVDTNVLVVESDNNRVGIGTLTPDNLLHVFSADSGGTTLAGGFLTVEGSGACFIQLLGAVNNNVGVRFGDSGNNGIGFLAYNHTSNYMQLATNAAERIRINSSGDLLVGTTTDPSAGNGKVLVFGDNAAQPTMGSNTAGIYGFDVAGTVEMFAVDEAGNDTQLTTHDSITGEFIHRSTNRYSGRELTILLEQLAQEVGRLSGKRFVVESWLPVPQCIDWNTVQAQQVAARARAIVEWDASDANYKIATARPNALVVQAVPPFIEAAMRAQGRPL